MKYIIFITIYYLFIISQPASGMIQAKSKVPIGSTYYKACAIVDLIFGIGCCMVLSFCRTETGEILYIPEYLFWMAFAGSILLLIFGCVYAIKAMCSLVP